ncbi:MAG: TPM domain-containing protein [Lawsonibacter sp.]|nr:TPM domain-containing protein [Lawsonibacter sp.]
MIKKITTHLCLLTIILMTVAVPFSALASFEGRSIYDNAGLFSESEVTELETSSKQNAEIADADIIIVTTDDLGGKTDVQYLEDFYDENAGDENGSYASAVLLLINMTPDARSVQIQGYGTAKIYINYYRIESILDEVVPYLSDGDYLGAMHEYINLSATYMQHESTSDHSESYSDTNYYASPHHASEQKEGSSAAPIIMLVASLVIGGIVTGVMIYQAGGVVTTNGNTYLNQSNSRIISKTDHYIRTTVTKVARPKQKNSDRDGGGGGISSRGNAHSGGRRSF